MMNWLKITLITNGTDWVGGLAEQEKKTGRFGGQSKKFVVGWAFGGTVRGNCKLN